MRRNATNSTQQTLCAVQAPTGDALPLANVRAQQHEGYIADEAPQKAVDAVAQQCEEARLLLVLAHPLAHLALYVFGQVQGSRSISARNAM